MPVVSTPDSMAPKGLTAPPRTPPPPPPRAHLKATFGADRTGAAIECFLGCLGQLCPFPRHRSGPYRPKGTSQRGVEGGLGYPPTGGD